MFSTVTAQLRSKSSAHDEEVRKLYEEMEQQINSENQRILAEEKARERQLKEEMERDLLEKDKQLQDLLSHHAEMEHKLSELNSQDAETKQENEKLEKKKSELEEYLEESQQQLDESRSYINQLRQQQREEKRERALAALHVTEGIALERESLVKQLDLLREMNRKLRDARDEAELRRFGDRLTSLSRSSSVTVATSSVTSEADGRSSASGISELHSRRQQLAKRGSVLSDYIADQMRRSNDNFESDIEVDEEEIECEMESVYRNHSAYTDRKSDTMSDERRMKRFGARNALDEESQDVIETTRQQPVGAHSPSDFTDSKTPDIESAAPERLFKVVFVGDSGVGKSSFVHRFCSNSFKTAFQATIGVDFQVKNLRIDGHVIAVQLWDTAGQERFRSITKQYFRKADGVLIMYDVTSEASFKSVRNWMTSVQEGTEEGTVLLVAGNKMDLIDDDTKQTVSHKDGTRLADEFRALFYETSVKTGLCVTEAMEAMARLLRDKEDKEMELALHLSEVARKRGCCK